MPMPAADTQEAMGTMSERQDPEGIEPVEPVDVDNHPGVQDADAFRRDLALQAGDEVDEAKASPELKRFWEAVKHLPAYARLVTAILRDPEVPKGAKGVLGLGGGYALSPIDLIPGIIPVAGQMDDLYAILTALQQSLKRMPDELAQKHLDGAGVTREQIEGDLAAVRDLAKLAVVRTAKFGGKALGRISRAALKFANDQLERRNSGRGETTGW
jgi:uncharacterized membrane protein YkvA (DUF1232 family)